MTEREQIEFLINRNETLRNTLGRCRTVLNNMARENAGWSSFFRRWTISHEPLRHDARNLLPIIDIVMAGNGARER